MCWSQNVLNFLSSMTFFKFLSLPGMTFLSHQLPKSNFTHLSRPVYSRISSLESFLISLTRQYLPSSPSLPATLACSIKLSTISSLELDKLLDSIVTLYSLLHFLQRVLRKGSTPKYLISYLVSQQPRGSLA